MTKYAFIAAQTAAWPVCKVCRMAGVSTSGYYRWRRTETSPKPAWQVVAQQAFTRHAGRYGTRRPRAEPRAEGHQVGRYALRSWLRASNGP